MSNNNTIQENNSTMKYISYFNNAVEGLFRQSPLNTTLATIENFKKQWRYRDYYQTLDALGFKVGVEYFVQQVWDEDIDEVISYVPSLKLHDGNPLTGRLEVIEFSEFKSADKAYGYIAKELIYRLMNIRSLDALIASRS